LTNVTLSGNSAKNDGGGLSTKRDVISQTLTLNNVTITNNTADSDNDGAGNGGGIYELVNPVLVQNSIIAGNFDTPDNAGGGTISPDCSGTFSSQGHNLIGSNDGCNDFVDGVNDDIVGAGTSPIDPLLGPLANNGGSTQTHALLPGSPALNAGNPLTPGSGGFACAANDQRGVTRPQSSACDVGAFEFEYKSLYLPLIGR
jgi:predicted outer membrane repeat protein